MSLPDSADVIVIGAGIGGLAAAIRLQASGYQVTLLEARQRPGGRAYQLRAAGHVFDMGPTLITAPGLIEQLWADAGRRLADDLELVPLAPFYRIYLRDGRRFDYGESSARDEEQAEAFEPGAGPRLRALLAATEQIHARAFEDLAGQPFDRFGSFARIVPELVRLGAARSVYRFVSRFFRDPALRMVYSFHPLFIGGNPLRASAIYSIVPFLERQGGVYFARGGMYRLVEAMEALFCDLGGQLVCDTPVEQILVEGGRVTGVRTGAGDRLAAPVVVANSDVATTYLELLPPSARRPMTAARLRRFRYSMSCFLLYLGLDRRYEQLLHHTIVMPADYPKLLRAIFDGQGLPSDLALYLQAPARTDPSLAPPGGESLTVLAPVPNLGHGIDWATESGPFRDRIIHFLEQELGLTGLEASIRVERRFTPVDFATQLGSWLGAAFAIEPTLTQSAYFRPHNRSGQIGGLYFVGAGTHPGAGLPGVLLSARITSQLVRQDSSPTRVERQPPVASRARVDQTV